jgi:multiple sugar transport system permease protein
MRTHKWFTPYLLVAPVVVSVLVFAIWPFLNTIVLAFTNARPLQAYNFVGLENFTRLFSDDRFGYALITCLVYVVACVPLLTLLPLLVALLVQSRVPGITFFRTTYYFPVVASVVVVGIIFKWLFDSDGVINQAMKALGLTDGSVNFLVDRWKLIGVAIGLTVWKGLGYYMVVYMASLGNVPRELHEAAALDGAGPWRRFWNVTVPGVRLGMILIMALIAVSAMRVFSELYVLSNGTGGPGGQAMSVVMMIQSVGKGLNGQIGYASAISVVLFVLTLGPLLAVGLANYGGDIKQMRADRRRSKAARVERRRLADAADAAADAAIVADAARVAERPDAFERAKASTR